MKVFLIVKSKETAVFCKIYQQNYKNVREVYLHKMDSLCVNWKVAI